ncbi:variable surface lipoprotein [Mycoplasmopsis agalactiae]|uniref:variable surface lipoprotein n=1 Tax=Mycoplasmopsis agalactiae TaxID=2110 RepID=UPI001F3F11B2|nr:variable surface lipoprotein [Mycoplasmopsis agalactiae]
MKKSKFLLLGSVASLASIPFVAAKCGDTKDEEKKQLKCLVEVKRILKTSAEGSQNQGTESGSNQQGSEINVKA